ncbi:MAG TPA: hypothetical protein VFA10_01735 [Ktedonobacteraceae bacterium]|nr:hypothetical protein [Ktedonobacteraceae bacterium]
MMPQMDPGGTIREQRDADYGRYEGNQGYRQDYGGGLGASPPPQGNIYDDDFMDSFAQRLSQRMGQGIGGKVQPQARSKASPGQRLALAIVSVIMLVGMAAIALGVAHDFLFVGLVALGMLCVTVILINVVFNNAS